VLWCGIWYVFPVDLAVKVEVEGWISQVLHRGLRQGYEPEGLDGLISLVGVCRTMESLMFGGRLKYTLGKSCAKSLVRADDVSR
jgi:hypothetical protein